MPKRQVYLVPGFFGYESLGAFNYFLRVKEVLKQDLANLGCEAEVIDCATQPTGSIRRRALRLINEIVEDGGLDADEIYLIAHSTGGLDSRLVLTPGVRLCPDETEARLAGKTRALVTVATPHFGTPLATFFTTFAGRQVLQFLTGMALSGPGRSSILAGVRLATAIVTYGDRVGIRESTLDYWAQNLLRFICKSPDNEIWTFLSEVASDQGAIIQLTPEGTDLFNSAVTDRDGVEYRCLITAAPPPPARSYRGIKVGLLPAAALFEILYRIAAKEHSHYPYPHDPKGASTQIEARLPFALNAKTSYGIVPTLSQIHGEVLDVVVADHLDIVGQFPNACGRPEADWLPSGAPFGETEFQRTWQRVAEFIAATANGR